MKKQKGEIALALALVFIVIGMAIGVGVESAKKPDTMVQQTQKTA